MRYSSSLTDLYSKEAIDEIDRTFCSCEGVSGEGARAHHRLYALLQHGFEILLP